MDREKVYVLGIPCHGKLDVNKMKEQGITGILSIEETEDKVKAETLYGTQECDRKQSF